MASGYTITHYYNTASNLNLYTTVDDIRVDRIGHGAFSGPLLPVVSISGNGILSISDYGFSGCRRLTTANFPNCAYIGSSAFYSCSSLTSISFPKCSYIGTDAFYDTPFQNNQFTASGYAQLSCVNGNKFLLSISSASGFTSFTGDHTFICGGAFYLCSSLTSAYFPNCSYVGDSAFRGCYSLSSISFPKCTYIGSDAFYNCSSLTSVSFPNCSYIDGRAFYDCSLLSQIYLMSTSVCALYNSKAFYSTGITSLTGSIVVTASLVSTYQAAPKWSYFSNRIFGA